MNKTKLTEKSMSDVLRCGVRVRDALLPLIASPWGKAEKATIFFVKRQPGARHATWLKLGVWPEVPIRVFRERALALLAGRVHQQSDYVVRAVSEFNDVKLLSDLLAWYTSSVVAQRDLSAQRNRNVRSVIQRQLLPALGEQKTRDLNHPVIKNKLIEPMAKAGYALSYIGLAIRTLKQIYAAAVKEQLLDVSPVTGLGLSLFTTAPVKNKPAAYHPGQIADVIKRIRNEPSYKVRCMIALALMHGLRVREVAGLCWGQHIDMTGKLLRLAADETKNGQQHLLPLTEPSLSVLRYHKTELRRHGHRGTKLFPASRNPRRSIGPTYASSLVSASLSRGAAHDLRKLARDWWQLNGIDFYIGELMLNHKGSAMLKTAHVYMQSTLIDNYRLALQRWHDCLLGYGLMEAVCGD